MKKIVVIVLIVVIVIMVGVLVFKHFVDALKMKAIEFESTISDIEDEIEDLSVAKKELMDKNQTLNVEKNDLEDKKQEINNCIKEYEQEIESLNNGMPRPDLGIFVEDFNLHMSIIVLNVKPDDKDKYLEPFTIQPTVTKNQRDDKVLTYWLSGDEDASDSLSISYTINKYNDNILEISLSYNGKDLKSLFDEYVSFTSISFVMLKNKPYFYDEKIIEEGKKLIADKKYLDGKVIVEEEKKDDSATFVIKPAKR